MAIPAPSPALRRLAAVAQQRMQRAAHTPAGQPVPLLPSPCIGICRLAEPAEVVEAAPVALCVGCWRSIDEIMAWRDASEPEKQRVWQAIVERADLGD